MKNLDLTDSAKNSLTYGFGKLSEAGHSAANFFHFNGYADVSDKLKLIGSVIAFIGIIAIAWYRIRKLKSSFRKVMTDPVAAWSRKVSKKQRQTYRNNITNSIPVLAIMNDQDGIGKSTITANLAAYFDQAGLNVLVLDYDVKDSLSHILPLAHPENIHYASDLILAADVEKTSFLKSMPEPDQLGTGFQHSWLYPTGAKLRKTEKELEYSWFMGKQKKDIRFNTHSFLSLPEIQNQYHIVLIDAPAGLSAIHANILCAATHVLTPTILDTVSINHTVQTLKEYSSFRDKLNLNFEFIGVLPSLVTPNGGKPVQREQEAHDSLTQKMTNVFGKLSHPLTRKRETLSILDSTILRRVAFISTDGTQLSYHRPSAPNNPVPDMVAEMGQEVFAKLGLEENENRIPKQKRDVKNYKNPKYVTGQKIVKVPVQKAA